MMKRTTFLAVAMAAALSIGGTALAQSVPAASDGAVRVCEAIIVSEVLSPASYKMVKAKVYQDGVVVTYDSANAFGTLLRSERVCRFVNLDGELRLSTEPLVTLKSGASDCSRKVDQWVAAGNLTSEAAKPFYDQCTAELAAAEVQFNRAIEDANVAYPVPAGATAVNP